MGHDTTAPRVIVEVVSLHDAAHAAEITSNLASITAIPLDVLPTGPARDALLRLAEHGHDTYAYQTPSRTWLVWCRPQWQYMDGRYTPEQWQEVYTREVTRILGMEVA